MYQNKNKNLRLLDIQSMRLINCSIRLSGVQYMRLTYEGRPRTFHTKMNPGSLENAQFNMEAGDRNTINILFGKLSHTWK